MLGLLIKDFYNIRKQALWYAAMIVLFCVISVFLHNVAFAATIGILVTISMPLTAIAYEEKDGWQKFVVASGLRTGTIVLEKYLLGILFALVSTAGYSAAFAIAGAETNQLMEFIAPVCMQFIALAVVLPIIFRFGVEKGRVYMIVLVVVLMAALIGLMPLFGDIMEDGGQLVFTVCIAAATVVLFVASYIISCAIYKHKEF